MANNALNVVAGKPKVAGGVYYGPLGTALPTDSTTALNAAFKSLGYAGDAGLVFTPTRDITPITAWGGDHVKDLATSYVETYQVTLIESLQGDTNKAVYGAGAVTLTAGDPTHGARIAVARTAALPPITEWVFEMADGVASRRVVLPLARITEVGDVTYSDGDVVGYQVTITAYADSAGHPSYEYTDDGIVVP